MRTSLLAVPLLLVAATRAAAQKDSSASSPAAPAFAASIHDSLSPTAQKTFFARRDLAYTAAAIAGTAAISAFDVRISHWMLVPNQQSSSFHSVVRPFNNVSETTVSWAAVAGYAAGRLAHSKMLTDVSLHIGEALVISTVFGQTVRGILGRERPSSSPDDQYSFHGGQGFGHFDERSFPSLHSAAAFILASGVTEEVHERAPGAVWYVGPALYALAAAPGIERMYLGQHWASDVAMGAFLGTLLGSRVVSYAHSHRRTKLDRVLLGAAPDGRGGALVTVSIIE